MPLEALGHRPRGSQASEAPLSASRENRTQSQTPARATSQASWEEQETELQEANTQNDQAPRSQAAVDKACEKVIPDHVESILPDVCRKVTRAIGQNKSQTFRYSSSRLSKLSLDHQTSYAPSGVGHVSGREAGKGRAHSGLAICVVFVRAIFFCRLPHACCRPGDSPTITGCVLLRGVCASRCSRNLSAKHRPRIDPKYSGFVRARPLSTAHLSMISVNNQRQHVGGEEGKQKCGARGMNTRTRLCNQRAERH